MLSFSGDSFEETTPHWSETGVIKYHNRTNTTNLKQLPQIFYLCRFFLIGENSLQVEPPNFGAFKVCIISREPSPGKDQRTEQRTN